MANKINSRETELTSQKGVFKTLIDSFDQSNRLN